MIGVQFSLVSWILTVSQMRVRPATIFPEIQHFYWNQLIFSSEGCLFAGGFPHVRHSALGGQCQTICPGIKQFSWNQLNFPLGAVFLPGAFHHSARVYSEVDAKWFPGTSSFSLWRLPFRWGLSATVHLEVNVCQWRPKMRLACWQGEAKTIVLKTIFHQSEVCPRRVS